MSTDRAWPFYFRVGWWVTTLTLAGLLASAAIIGGKWIYSRASDEDVAKKVDKTDHKEDITNLDKRIEKQERVLGTVHINVVKLLERSNIKPQKIIEDDE